MNRISYSNSVVRSSVRAAMLANLNQRNIQSLSDCYGLQHKPGASLIEPINGDPYVVTFEENRAVVHEFKGAENSGTDKLRARIEASQFFGALQ